MDDGVEMEHGADPLDPDTDDDGILDGPDGLGDDDDGIINVLDPTDDTIGDDDDDLVIEDPDVVDGDGCDCQSSLAGRSGGLSLLLLLLAVPLRRAVLQSAACGSYPLAIVEIDHLPGRSGHAGAGSGCGPLRGRVVVSVAGRGGGPRVGPRWSRD